MPQGPKSFWAFRETGPCFEDGLKQKFSSFVRSGYVWKYSHIYLSCRFVLKMTLLWRQTVWSLWLAFRVQCLKSRPWWLKGQISRLISPLPFPHKEQVNLQVKPKAMLSSWLEHRSSIKYQIESRWTGQIVGLLS